MRIPLERLSSMSFVSRTFCLLSLFVIAIQYVVGEFSFACIISTQCSPKLCATKDACMRDAQLSFAVPIVCILRIISADADLGGRMHIRECLLFACCTQRTRLTRAPVTLPCIPRTESNSLTPTLCSFQCSSTSAKTHRPSHYTRSRDPSTTTIFLGHLRQAFSAALITHP